MKYVLIFLYVIAFLIQYIMILFEKKAFIASLKKNNEMFFFSKTIYDDYIQEELFDSSLNKIKLYLKFIFVLLIYLLMRFIPSLSSYLYYFLIPLLLFIVDLIGLFLNRKKEKISCLKIISALLLNILIYGVFPFVIEWLSTYIMYPEIFVYLIVLFLLILVNSLLPLVLLMFLKKKVRRIPVYDGLKPILDRSNIHIDSIWIIKGISIFHNNAMYIQMFKKKYLVVDESLSHLLSKEELIAVLYHEIGHGIHHDILLKMVLIILLTPILCIFPLVFSHSLYFYQLFNLENISYSFFYLFYFVVLFPILLYSITLVINMVSRKREAKADGFAVTNGYSWPLYSALKKIGKRQYVPLFEVGVEGYVRDVHPPILERLQNILDIKLKGDDYMDELKNASEIDLSMLQQMGEEYEKNSIHKVVCNALAKTQLTELVQNTHQKELLQPNFSIEIKTRNVCNQKSSGRCWIFAGMNVLREIIANRLQLDQFEISQNYFAFFDKFEKFNFALESIQSLLDRPVNDRTLSYITHEGICDGGQWDMFVSIVKKYGIVPQSVMVETFQSSNTRDMNFVINTQIRKFASIAKKYYDEQKFDEIDKYKEEILHKMYNFLCMGFGTPVKKFDFEYTDKQGNYHLEKDYTPNSFYQKYIGDLLDEFVSVVNAPTKDKPYYQMLTIKYLGNVVHGTPIHYLNLPMDEVVDLCVKQLQAGEVVWFGSDCGKYGDRTTGIWDDESYDYQSPFDFDMTISKEDMLDYGQSAMNHAMVITGVTLVDGVPTKWKIENSWGEQSGNKGYFVMSNNWFRQFVFQAVIKRKYLSPEQAVVLNQSPLEYDPWDPMGTLAKK